MAFAVNIPVFVLLLLTITLQPLSASPQLVPCFFVFGDSLVDNGNNNQRMTTAKADYRPYGVDFPGGPTGRFTNGLNTADMLGRFLGFDSFIPPFATARGEAIINGVNYASGSSGIRNETGRHMGDNINLDRQLLNHNLTVSRIADLLGNDTAAKQHLSKCLYYFVVGSNDYINNYYLPEYYPTSTKYTPQEYATVLSQQYSEQLTTLYNLGARKVSVSGLFGPLGCIPAQLGRGRNRSACAGSIQGGGRFFNDELKRVVIELNKKLRDAKFMYVRGMDLRPAEVLGVGIRFVIQACCKVSNFTGLCISGQSPCPVRGLHMFYDNFHPTEHVNNLVATTTYFDILKLIL